MKVKSPAPTCAQLSFWPAAAAPFQTVPTGLDLSLLVWLCEWRGRVAHGVPTPEPVIPLVVAHMHLTCTLPAPPIPGRAPPCLNCWMALRVRGATLTCPSACPSWTDTSEGCWATVGGGMAGDIRAGWSHAARLSPLPWCLAHRRISPPCLLASLPAVQGHGHCCDGQERGGCGEEGGLPHGHAKQVRGIEAFRGGEGGMQAALSSSTSQKATTTLLAPTHGLTHHHPIITAGCPSK